MSRILPLHHCPMNTWVKASAPKLVYIRPVTHNSARAGNLAVVHPLALHIVSDRLLKHERDIEPQSLRHVDSSARQTEVQAGKYKSKACSRGLIVEGS